MDTLLRTMLAAVKNGELDVEEACRRLAAWPCEQLPFATIDHHRDLRTGFPEVIYCAGKTPFQVAAIGGRIWRQAGRLFATRAEPEHAEALRAEVPQARYNPLARTVSAGAPAPSPGPAVLVLTAGTSDLPVAEEAVETIRAMGEPVVRIADIGVAGVHRLLMHEAEIANAGVIVVVAGMDGALASVAGGLARAPVIAVPTSVGYGASFGGLGALLAMLNSCAAGVVTVNIDNGFGAGVAAARINRLRVVEVAGAGVTAGAERAPGACA
ncbi:MAG TPA: nickel pincer cofactor biosynthesis protein LarB [Gemmatimonadota bacterium]|nr:nickel pincer cofactor biosynthesis protein LarB [Gemmatimonadota bacterium]